MKSDLEELIDSYQNEKTELEKQISEYVEEGDYLYAHYHNKALSMLNKTLDVLKTLHNPVHRNISDEEMRIKGFNKMLASPHYNGSNDLLKTYMYKSISQSIIESEEKIQKLKNTEIQCHYDSQEVDDALFSLVNGDIKRFVLYFKSLPDVFLKFEIIDNAIEIRTALDEDIQWKKDKINQLRHAGFCLQDTEWVYNYLLNRFKDGLEIKMMLSHLIYDVFNYDSRYDVAKLVYD